MLLTVTLLAFLVLLLVGLATYTRVETAIAGNMQRQAQARENALFALNVALGQLQKQAGPDRRVTATAAGTANPFWTGAWKTDPSDPDYAMPAWLVSGLESASAPDPATALNQTDDTNVRLVGPKTVSSTSEHVWAKKQDIKAPGVPGQSGNALIGKYAWWVGDQGVKAPVALPDNSGAIDFAPWVATNASGGSSTDLRERIRQQVALGAGAADAGGAPVFEPRDTGGSPSTAALAANVTTTSQLAFMRPAGSTSGTIGLATQQKNFHAWSPNNFAVLANSKLGGLRQDLSLQPDLLGAAFVAWQDYPSYMEDPFAAPATSSSNNSSSAGAAPAAAALAIQPPYGDNPLRRRYVMTPHLLDPSVKGSHQVGPVLTYFLLTFSVSTALTPGGNHTTAANSPMIVRARWMATLWNPYSSALVPEDLQLEVSGLPNSVRIIDDNSTRSGQLVGQFSLASAAAFGSPLLMSLPWASANKPTDATPEDFQSWLPGRVYTWRSAEDLSGNSPPPDGYASDFYSRTLDAGGKGVTRALNFTIADGGDDCHLEVNGSSNLRINIYAVRASGRVRLAGLVSPDFVTSFTTDVQAASKGEYQFGYVFRLAESLDTPAAPGTWLMTDGRDLRRRTVPSECYVVEAKGNDPAQYGNSFKTISSPDRLLDRAADSYTYNEDVPIFELPRAPLLSLGALQHFRIVGRRPFMIGNSWGAGETLNDVPLLGLFDRYYFSGLVNGVTPSKTSTGDMLVPNPLLKPLRKPDGSKVVIDDVRALTNAFSSKFFLQGGAFNLNSTNAAAWAAVLRSVRFPAPGKFTYLEADSATGTAPDATVSSVSSADAQFFRFSQSAQETYKAEPGQSGGVAATELFRRGMRSLDAAKVSALATAIANAVKTRIADPALGPFRCLEEFLSPVNGGPSLLEQAIADANINVDASGNPIEFSSQFLTQGDIMTALAPVLFPRSDTFAIRTYGEASNPATGAVEGRAWAEAIVQRVPEYFDADATTGDAAEVAPADLKSALNKLHGRRFKVVSFRWLTRSDI